MRLNPYMVLACAVDVAMYVFVFMAGWRVGVTVIVCHVASIAFRQAARYFDED